MGQICSKGLWFATLRNVENYRSTWQSADVLAKKSAKMLNARQVLLFTIINMLLLLGKPTSNVVHNIETTNS